MKTIYFLSSIVLLATGCAYGPITHGVPNFAVIVPATNGQPEIDRGGEPTAEGWTWLASRGITRDIKLDSGKDTPANGIRVINVQIGTIEQIFGNGLERDVQKAVLEITPGTYVHCTYGRNRTGTVCMCYRRDNGWSKEACLAEANTHGWGNSLPGLKWFWYTKVK